MRVLLAVLLVGIAGCGGNDNSPDDGAAPASTASSPVKAENATEGAPKPKTGESPAEALDADLVAALEKIGAGVKRNEQGQIVEVSSYGSSRFNLGVTDAELVQLSNLSSLERLLLNDVKITDDGLLSLKVLTNMKVVVLNDTEITDAGLGHLTVLTELQSLSLYGTNITDAGLVHVSGMSKLEELGLGATAVTDTGLVHLKGLSKLKFLWLSPQITDAGLEHVRGMTNLQTLLMSSTTISDNGLAQLKGMNLKALPPNRVRMEGLDVPRRAKTDLGLVHYLAAVEAPTILNFDGWKITDGSVLPLKELTQLKELHLAGTDISDAGIAELKKALPNCKISR